MIEYNTDLFEAETVERMVAHYLRLIEAALADPDAPVSRHGLLDETERRAIVETWNHPPRAYPEVCIHEIIQDRVREQPDAPAVVFEDTTLRS